MQTAKMTFFPADFLQ